MKQETIASKVGRPPKFKTALELAQIADAYFTKRGNSPPRVRSHTERKEKARHSLP